MGHFARNERKMEEVPDFDANPLKKDFDLVNVGVNFLTHIGMHPNNRTTKGKLAAIFFHSLRFVLIFLVIYEFMQHYGSPIAFVDFVESMTTLTQGLIKMEIVLARNTIFQQLYAGMKSFWPLQNTRSNLAEYNRWMRFLSFYRAMFYSTLVIFVLTSVWRHEPIMKLYIPNYPFAFWLILLGFIALFLWDIFLVGFIDVNFLAMCFLIRKQCDAIEDKLNEISLNYDNVQCMTSKRGRKLFVETRSCIVHNKFIVWFTSNLFNMYTFVLFYQYFTTMFAICIQLYGLSERGSILGIARSIIYGLTLLVQLGLFCFPADETSFAVSNIGDYFYNSKWYDKPNEYQKLFLLPIQRTQRSLQFKAVNMLIVNKETYVKMIKGSFSFYTLLKQFKDLYYTLP